ncbi:FAD-binding oxidoreductase [Aspergillus foveolatus]|uniref:FAD-binding oxidoreductase n=1 Tax=Aspergillus foveolatus TaxID=210207 RepID=UPI003CCD0509
MKSYFSQQNAALRPLCVISPTDADDVSTTIVSIAQTSSLLSITDKSQCHFSIRSGGHTSLIGEASNIQNGITIDLSRLNTIRLSDDQTTASVGVGTTWGEVYSYLDSLNLSVAGGRAAQVGVGGLTLGGGISYHSPRYGWTCDTASEFEIVLPNGTIVHATEEEHPDLTMALRGGSANFGIVTEVKLRTFEQGLVWGGHVYYPLETINDQLRAFESFNIARGYDEYASLIGSFGYASGQGAAVVNSIVYTREEEYPEVFANFFKMPSAYSTMRVASMHNISIEQGSFQPNGNRQLNVVITHGSTVDMLNATYLRWKSSLPEIEDVRGIVWSVSLEPLPPAIYARAPTKNALGLSNTTGSQVVTLLSATWEDETDDERIHNTARVLFEGIEEDARRLNSYESFLYLNYAADWQDPIASYGEKSIELLRRVSRDVDLEGLFRKGMPGGFKIPPEHHR